MTYIVKPAIILASRPFLSSAAFASAAALAAVSLPVIVVLAVVEVAAAAGVDVDDGLLIAEYYNQCNEMSNELTHNTEGQWWLSVRNAQRCVIKLHDSNIEMMESVNHNNQQQCGSGRFCRSYHSQSQ
jgi:hypothetical protein